MEFTKCQGCQLLTSLSAVARATLRHFEVAAVLQTFQPRSPLHAAGGSVAQKSFVYVVVTDWKLLLVSLPSPKAGPQVLLELPFPVIQHLEMRPVLDAGDVVNDARGAVRAEQIMIYPQPQQQPQRQQVSKQQLADAMVDALRRQLQDQQLASQAQHHLHAQVHTPPWQQHGQRLTQHPQAAGNCGMASMHSQGHQQQQQQHSEQPCRHVQVQHVSTTSNGHGSYSSAAGGSTARCRTHLQHERPHQAAGWDPSYCLTLLTVERCSLLWFHVHKAWVGLHMRAALAAAGAPGLRSWGAPPTASEKAASAPAGAAALGQQQQRQQQQRQRQWRSHVDILVLHGSSEVAFGHHSTNIKPAGGLTPRQPHEDTIPEAADEEDEAALLHLPCSQHSCSLHGRPYSRHRFWRLSESSPTQGTMDTMQQQQPTGGCETGPSGLRPGSVSGWGPQRSLGSHQHLGMLARRCTTADSSNRPKTAPAPGSSSSGSTSGHAGALHACLDQDRQDSFRQQPARRTSLLQWPKWAHTWREVAAAGLFGLSRPASRASATAGGVPASSRDASSIRLGSPLLPSPPASRDGGRPFSRGQQHVLREFMQEGAEVLTQPTASAARQLFWELSDALMAPCSLFDTADVAVLQRMMLELASSSQEQAAALQGAFFDSSKVMSFIVARFTSWGALLGLFAEGLPPIQNPAQPGSIEAWSGRPVVWSTWLAYPGRPSQLLKALGLTQRSNICFRSALKSVLHVTQRHQAAAAALAASQPATAAAGPSSSTAGNPTCYHADPLQLSPLTCMPYLFVASARRMVTDARLSITDTINTASSGGRHSSASQAGLGGWSSSGYSRQQHPSHSSPPSGFDSTTSTSTGGYDMSTQGTLAEVTNVLRWERLVGRLAARAAQRKLAVLLQWLQLHLAFTEGCSSRGAWLSGKAVSAAPANSVLAAPWTFRNATQQLIAYLLTLPIPGVRTNLAAAAAAAAAATAAPGACASKLAHGAAAPCQHWAGHWPQDKEDFLWWTVAGNAGSDSNTELLDNAVGVLFELCCLSQQEDQLRSGTHWAAGAVMEVLREVPPSCLHPLLRALFLRFICLMAGTTEGATAPRQASSSLQSAAGSNLPADLCAVLAHRYGLVLLEVLGGVLGCAGRLHEDFGVEVQHLMAVPQVAAQLAAVAACCSRDVLVTLNKNVLDRVLAAVGAAAPRAADANEQQPGVSLGLQTPQQSHCSTQRLRARLQDARLVGTVMKVQN